jgi:hypothetical protein
MFLGVGWEDPLKAEDLLDMPPDAYPHDPRWCMLLMGPKRGVGTL